MYGMTQPHEPVHPTAWVDVNDVVVGDLVVTNVGDMKVAAVREMPRMRRFDLYVHGTALFNPWTMGGSETAPVTKRRTSKIQVRDRTRWIVTLWRSLGDRGEYLSRTDARPIGERGANELWVEDLYPTRTQAVAAVDRMLQDMPGSWIEIRVGEARPGGDFSTAGPRRPRCTATHRPTGSGVPAARPLGVAPGAALTGAVLHVG